MLSYARRVHCAHLASEIEVNEYFVDQDTRCPCHERDNRQMLYAQNEDSPEITDTVRLPPHHARTFPLHRSLDTGSRLSVLLAVASAYQKDGVQLGDIVASGDATVSSSATSWTTSHKGVFNGKYCGSSCSTIVVAVRQ